MEARKAAVLGKPPKQKDAAPSKTKGMMQEAADMENKLLELRKQMELERARRETIMASAQNGSLWKSGATGPLRRKGGPGSATSSPAGKDRTSPREQQASPGPASTSAPASARSLGSRGASGSGMGDASVPADMLLAAGRLPSGGRSSGNGSMGWQQQQGEAKGPPPAGVSAVAMAPARRPSPAAANVLTVHQEPGGGMSCGTDDNDDLAGGNFNEADSHRSFMEALNEWRAQTRGEQPAAAATATAASAGVARSHAVGASMECQTETAARGQGAAAGRPVSASKKSYFDKLALNLTSRQAGSEATGGVLDPIQRQASQGVASGALPPPRSDPSSSSAAAAAGPSRAAAGAGGGGAPPQTELEARMALLDRLELLEMMQAEEAQAEAEMLARQGDDSIVVTNEKTLGLTKGTHLPDAILLPDEYNPMDEPW